MNCSTVDLSRFLIIEMFNPLVPTSKVPSCRCPAIRDVTNVSRLSLGSRFMIDPSSVLIARKAVATDVGIGNPKSTTKSMSSPKSAADVDPRRGQRIPGRCLDLPQGHAQLRDTGLEIPGKTELDEDLLDLGDPVDLGE